MEGHEIRSQLEKCHSDSYGWALHCCRGNAVDAEDMLQTAYLKVLQGKAGFDGRSSFKTWLFAVIRNTAAAHRRWMALRNFKFLRFEEGSDFASKEDSPSKTLEKKQVQDDFKKALKELPKRQTEVLQLVFYHDLTIEEAAQVMGVSLGSARTHYDRGKKALKKGLIKGK